MNWIDDLISNGGFEDGVFAPWSTSTGAGNSLEVNSASKYSGNYGCDFGYDGAGNASYIQNTTVTAEEIWIRLVFYLPPDFHQTDTSEWRKLIYCRKDFSLRFQAYLQRNAGGDLKCGVDYQGGAKSWNNYGDVTKEVWHCIQIHYRSNSLDGGVEWWFDGVHQNADFGHDLTGRTGALNNLILGIDIKTATACHMYVDSIIVADTLIPPISAPTCDTQTATAVKTATATLNGKCTDDGSLVCQYRFQYGKTIEYELGNTGWEGAVYTNNNFHKRLESLDANTTYHFRSQVKNSAT